MKGWGSVGFFAGGALVVAVGCGGRTLGDEYEEPGSAGLGAGAGRGGSAGRGGMRPTAGSVGVGGVGGSVVGYGGTYVGGSSAGGAYPNPGGGYPYPYPYGGAYSYGGVYPGGGAYSYGGAYPYGGSVGVGGGFPAGGFGGGSGENCCQARGGPLCEPYPVAKCVCATLPHCCTLNWDDRCAAMVEPLGCGYCGKPPEDCQTCIFQSCRAELTRCFADAGCLAIFGCVQATGCDTYECYRPETCGAVIEQYGGLAGPSMSYLIQAVSCSLESGCPCN